MSAIGGRSGEPSRTSPVHGAESQGSRPAGGTYLEVAMKRVLVCGVALALCSLVALAQDAPQKGKIKKVDADRGVLTVGSGGGKDVDLTVMESTRFMGADGNPIRDGLKDKAFKEGAMVMFKTVSKGDKTMLIG